MKKIWYHFFDCDGVPKRKIIQNFSNPDFEFYEFNPNQNGGMGLVFFDQVSQSLYDFLYEVSQSGNNRILVISTSPSELDSETPWRLIHSGASDVLTLDNSYKIIEKIIARFKRWIAIEEVIGSPLVSTLLIGKSKEWKSVLREIVEMACFTDSAVLITGESGTGKELIARLIHTLDSKRSKQELVLLDCTTIVPELSGSEFFGHERGAFTGAITARDGAFALANDSTLFLDEVGELPLNLQTQLLRVIQEHTFKRVGGNTWHNTDFRLICATNKDLVEAIKQGKFRSDLYYSIAQWTCILPPLSKRCEDILPLAKYFIKLFLPTGETPELDKSVCEHL